jgi:lipopolysaccharide transport system permease protein
MRGGYALPGVDELGRIGELLVCLAWRDLRVRYKQSVLGVAWAVVQPISLMVVFTFVLGPTVSRSLPDGLPYGLFVFAGLVPWTYFSAGLMQCVNSLVANRNLVTKVYFPREAFPFSCVTTSLVDFCIGLLALAGLMAYYHAEGSWSFAWHPSLLFVPAICLVQTVLTAGLGMLLAMGNLFYRDVRQILGVALQLGMFVSAVVVPAPTGSSWTARIFAINPIVPIISGYRDCLLHGRLPDAIGFGYAAAVSLAVLLAGWIAFRRASFRFAECI